MNSEFDYVALYFRKFGAAVQGYDATFVGAYWLAVLAYWCDDVKGLRDDTGYLRRICRVESEDEWLRVHAILFNNDEPFFKLEDGRWHQKRAKEEYTKAKQAVESHRARGSKGGKARAKLRMVRATPPPKKH